MQHPLLHWHHLCPGSDPQHLSCLHHRRCFLTAFPAAVYNTDAWGMVLNSENSSISSPYHHHQRWFKSVSPLSRLISNPVRWQTKTFLIWPLTTFPAIFPAIYSCPLFSKIPFVSHTPECSLILEQLRAWDSCPSACLSRSLLLQGSAMLRTFCEPIRVERGVLLWLLVCRVSHGALLFLPALQGATYHCHSALFSFVSNGERNAWCQKSLNKYLLNECTNAEMKPWNSHSCVATEQLYESDTNIRKDINHTINCYFILVYSCVSHTEREGNSINVSFF